MRASILIIDDDANFAQSVKSLLKKQGLKVCVAADPAEALDIYKNEKMDFDLLMIDYHFKNSNITGSDLAERIKRQNSHQNFLFMSGFDEKDFLKSMLKVGSSRNFIEKGCAPERIVEVVNRTLSECGITEGSPATDLAHFPNAFA